MSTNKRRDIVSGDRLAQAGEAMSATCKCGKPGHWWITNTRGVCEEHYQEWSKTRCQRDVWDNFSRYNRCQRTAVETVDGRRLCKQHAKIVRNICHK